MKACKGSGFTVPLINLGTRWGWVVSITLRSLYLRGRPPGDQVNKHLDGTLSRFWRFGENVLFLSVSELRIIQPVPTELVRFHPLLKLDLKCPKNKCRKINRPLHLKEAIFLPHGTGKVVVLFLRNYDGFDVWSVTERNGHFARW